MGLNNRQIRIFISSTFNDLNVERDYLINNVFKTLSQRATMRDVSVIPLDLRWGITAEESRQKQVVKICLDEIRRTRPFFIGIIGERYGWCPRDSEIGDCSDLGEQYGWVSDAVKENLSITEMEMLYGVLNNPEQMEAFFYIKNVNIKSSKVGHPEETMEMQKLENLRKKIIENKRYPVYYFSDKEELGSLVEQNFMSMLNRLYPEPVSAPEREYAIQMSLLNSLKDNYIPIPSLYKSLDNFLFNKRKKILAVVSPNGMGKSALLANWLSKSHNIKKMIVVSYFVSRTGTTTGEYVIKRIVEQLNEKLGILPLNEVERPEASLVRIMSTTDSDILIVIDGLNQIPDEEHQRLTWLPEPMGNTKMIVSTAQGSETEEVLEIREAEKLEVCNLTKKARVLLLNDYYEHRAKKMNDQQISRITDCPLCENTFLFKTLLSQISDFGHFELLDDEISKYVSATSEEAFYQQVLMSMEIHYGLDIVTQVLCLIAISRNGLSEQELFDILHFRMLDWTQFYAAIHSHIRVVNGLIYFCQETIRHAVLSRYLKAETKKSYWQEKLINHFCRSPFSHRKVDELAWQYAEKKDYKQLFLMLQDLRVEEYLYSKDMYELGRYWHLVINNNSTAYSFASLLDAAVPENFDDYRLGFLYGNLTVFSHIVLSDHDTAVTMAKIYLEKYELNDSNPKLRSSFLFLLTGLCQESGRSNDAILFCQKGLSISLKYWGESQESNKFLHRLALLRKMRREWKEAEQSYLRVLHYLEMEDSCSSKEAAEVLNELGEVYVGLNQTDKALKYMNRALDIRIKLFGEKNTWVANSYNTIGSLYEKNKEPEKALEMFNKGYLIRLELFGEKHTDTQSCVSNIIRVLIDTNRFEKAFAMLEKQLSIRTKTLPKGHMLIGITYHNKGFAEYRAGNFKQALNSLLRALDIFIKNKRTEDPDTISCLKNISLVYCEMECYSKALEYITRSLEAGRNYYGEYNEKTAELYLNRAFIFSEMDQFNKAINDDHSCLNILDSLNYSNERLKGDAFYRCALDYENSQNNSQAMEYAFKAAQCRKVLLGEMHEEYINCLIEIMDIYYNMGEWEECIKKAEATLQLLKVCGREIDEDSGRCLYQIARCCGFLGQYEKGYHHAYKNLEVRSKATPNDKLALARANYEVAFHCIRLEQFQKAEGYGRKAVRINQESGKEGLEQLSEANNLMGVVYYNQKRYEESIPYYRQTLLWREKNLSHNHEKLLSIRQNLAYALIGTGKCDEAFDLLIAVLEVQMDTVPINEKAVDRTFRNLAECVDKQDLGIKKTSQIVNNLLQRNILTSRTARLCKRLAFDAYHCGDTQKALKYWKHEACIRECDLKEKSEDTAWALSNVGVMLRDSNCYSEALEYFQKSICIWKDLQGSDDMVKKLSVEIDRLLRIQR